MKKFLFWWCLTASMACNKQQPASPSPDPDPAIPLTIATISPSDAASGPVTIKGTGFSATLAENEVRFGVLAATVQSATATQLEVALPPDMTPGAHDVTVKIKAQTVTKAKGFRLRGWVVSTFAGTGVWASDDGPADKASFRQPTGIAVDAAGNFYVPDLHKIRKITPQGVVSTIAGGNGKGYIDDTGINARFNTITSVVLDKANNLYVVDQMNFLIRKITPAGVVSTVAGTVGVLGKKDGIGTHAAFSVPYGLAINAAGTHLYVGDQANHVIRKIALATSEVTTIAGSGEQTSKDGNGLQAGIPSPGSMAFDADGILYITEKGGGKVRKMTPNGDITTIGGHLDVNSSPTHVVVDDEKNVYVTFSGMGKIKKYTPAGVESNFAGNNTGTGAEDGPAAVVFFQRPEGIALVKDPAGNPVFYIVDALRHKIKMIRKE